MEPAVLPRKETVMRNLGSINALLVIIAALSLTIDPRPAMAAWPAFGRAISAAPGSQDDAMAATDGAAGAIVTWVDAASGVVDLFAQHVLASGELDPAWPSGGRALLTDPSTLPGPSGSQVFPVIVSDGAGGAIVAWQDGRSLAGTDVFAQHVLANGQIDGRWPANGTALCTFTGNQTSLAIASDGAGGALVTWMDGRSPATGIDIFAQHVLVSGEVDPDWKTDGAAVCTAPGRQARPQIDADGAGGAIVTWEDPRSSVTSFDIYAQHMLSSGLADLAWPTDGQALCTAPGGQLLPTIVSDGAHGAIVSWTDNRDPTPHIFAHHILASGALDRAWPVNGLVLVTAPIEQQLSILVSDGAGGAIVSWQDQRSGVHNMYAQHVRVTGVVDAGWPINGIALSSRPTEQNGAVIVPDGAGGAVVTWQDGGTDIFAQHVLASGVLDPAFPTAGQPVIALPSVENKPSMVAAGGGSGAIITWTDFRSGSSDIDALQLLTVVATAGVDDPGPSREVLLAAPRPNPARGSLALRFTLPRTTRVDLAIYDLAGRQVRQLVSEAQAAGDHSIGWDLRDDAGRAVGAGLFFARLDAEGRVLTQKVATLR
jgi:hypothetical protein